MRTFANYGMLTKAFYYKARIYGVNSVVFFGVLSYKISGTCSQNLVDLQSFGAGEQRELKDF